MAREDECFYVEQCEKDCGSSLESNGAVKKSRAVFALFAAPVAHVEIAIVREGTLLKK